MPDSQGSNPDQARPDEAAILLPEIMFDKTTPPEQRLVIADAWGGQARMSTAAFIRLSQEGVSDRFAALTRIANADDLPAVAPVGFKPPRHLHSLFIGRADS